MTFNFEIMSIVTWYLCRQEPDHPDAEEQYVFEDMQVMNDHDLHNFCLKYKVIDEFLSDI